MVARKASSAGIREVSMVAILRRGGVSERPKVRASKAREDENSPRVQIPPPPPLSFSIKKFIQ